MHAKIPHLPEAATEVSEHDPLLGRSSEVQSDADAEDEASDSETRPAGGTILGIHNLAIVMPQFIVSSVIFSLETSLSLSRLDRYSLICDIPYRRRICSHFNSLTHSRSRT